MEDKMLVLLLLVTILYGTLNWIWLWMVLNKLKELKWVLIRKR